MSTQTPRNTQHEVDQDEIALDFLLMPRSLDPFAYGGSASPSKPAGERLRAFSIPSQHVVTLDHLYGPEAALQLLTAHFELKSTARFEASHADSQVAILVDEVDYMRLGQKRFERELVTALQVLVSEIPEADALRASDQVAIQALIEAEVLDRGHAVKLGDRGREELLELDLGI